MDRLQDWLKLTLGFSQVTQQKMIVSIILVLVLWIGHRILLSSVVFRIKNLESRYQWQKSVGYIFSAAGIVVIGIVWIEGMQYAATFLGLLSAGLAIALKDPITNFIAWGFILWRRPFEVGDRIQIGNNAGDVVDLRIFQFSMMEIGNWVDADQSTGRILHIPNGLVFTNVVANYTKAAEYIWNEIPVVLTFESGWEKAKDILQTIVEKYDASINQDVNQQFESASKRLMLRYGKLSPIVYTSVVDHGVKLTIRYLCPPRKRRGSNQDIWENILWEFAQHDDIQLAYPTQRFYSHPTDVDHGEKRRTE